MNTDPDPAATVDGTAITTEIDADDDAGPGPAATADTSGAPADLLARAATTGALSA